MTAKTNAISFPHNDDDDDDDDLSLRNEDPPSTV